uniref:Uncharacterized protein n=1 Tax=Cucumis melo TaxID=3656 RepID=A0A9I9E551_CUCME
MQLRFHIWTRFSILESTDVAVEGIRRQQKKNW